MHAGLDIAAAPGSPVHSPANGIVSYAGYEPGSGDLTIRRAGTLRDLDVKLADDRLVLAFLAELSRRGLSQASPSFVGIYGHETWSEAAFEDLLTGRPAYDLLPIAYAEPLRLDAARLARPVAVHATLRPYAVPEPLTELHFQSGANGLQSIDAVHVQNRRPTFFGRPGFLQALGRAGEAAQLFAHFAQEADRYGGAVANGEVEVLDEFGDAVHGRAFGERTGATVHRSA